MMTSSSVLIRATSPTYPGDDCPIHFTGRGVDRRQYYVRRVTPRERQTRAWAKHFEYIGHPMLLLNNRSPSGRPGESHITDSEDN